MSTFMDRMDVTSAPGEGTRVVMAKKIEREVENA